jgi:hypothetical protein
MRSFRLVQVRRPAGQNSCRLWRPAIRSNDVANGSDRQRADIETRTTLVLLKGEHR